MSWTYINSTNSSFLIFSPIESIKTFISNSFFNSASREKSVTNVIALQIPLQFTDLYFLFIRSAGRSSSFTKTVSSSSSSTILTHLLIFLRTLRSFCLASMQYLWESLHFPTTKLRFHTTPCIDRHRIFKYLINFLNAPLRLIRCKLCLDLEYASFPRPIKLLVVTKGLLETRKSKIM